MFNPPFAKGRDRVGCITEKYISCKIILEQFIALAINLIIELFQYPEGAYNETNCTE